MYAPPLHAIARLVNYLYEDEHRNYHQYEPEDRPIEHIFESISEVARWLWPFDEDVSAALDSRCEQVRLLDERGSAQS